MNRCAWLILVGLTATGAFRWTQASSNGNEAPAKPALRVLFPADRNVVETGQFALIAVQPKEDSLKPPPPFLVDGVAQCWEPYRAPVLVARLKLSPGAHQLLIESQTLNVFVRGEKAPEPPSGWTLFRKHPPSTLGEKECQSCHVVSDEGHKITLSAPRTPAACDPCHSDEKFGVTHFHPKQPLAACQMCHALHGSGRLALLKKPAKELCATCHE